MTRLELRTLADLAAHFSTLPADALWLSQVIERYKYTPLPSHALAHISYIRALPARGGADEPDCA